VNTETTEQSRTDKIVGRVPEHMRESLKAYIDEGQPPGSFLRAVLENKLLESFQRADDINRFSMQAWASALYRMPWRAWGSPEKVNAWITHGGLFGGPE